MRIKNRVHGELKSSGKHRGLRDYSNQPPERPLRQQTLVVTTQLPEHQPGVQIWVGGCDDFPCGNEAACKPTQGGNHYCLCPDDGEPATSNFTCPRRPVPLTPKPIHNVIPPRVTNSSTLEDTRETDFKYVSLPPSPEVSMSISGEYNQDLPSDANGEYFISTASNSVTARTNTGVLVISATIGGALLVVLLVSLIIFYLRRRVCRVDGKKQPRVRPGEPLLADRYITNPQYALCSTEGLVATGTLTGSMKGTESNESLVPLIDESSLTLLVEVGEGCFGKVHKGFLRIDNEEQVVAIKVLKESAGRSAEEDFAREVTIMSSFKHPNILTLIGVVCRENIGGSPWMVFEYMEWGDLAGVLRGFRGSGRSGPALNGNALLHVALQVAQGMKYLASRRFVHRDLAARNCLVGSQLTVKIADFGMSRDVYTCDYYKMGGERPMPVRWMSPESIVYARFTHESDVWSYGVVLWEIYSRGKQPFYGHNNKGATKIILQGILLVPPEDCPRYACELMRSCWQSDPRDRIGFEEICKNLEVAAEAVNSDAQFGQIRSPQPQQDSKGYLVPSANTPVEYLSPLPEPCSTVLEILSSDEDDDEYEDDQYT